MNDAERIAYLEDEVAKWSKENHDLKEQLATLKAAGDAELEGLLKRLMAARVAHEAQTTGETITELYASLDAIRTHVAGLRQRIKELSLFRPVPDEELERAMASYGRTIEAVVIRKAVRALEQRIKELEEAAEEANDRWREMGMKGDG